MGIAQAMTGRLNDAIEHFERAVELAPNSADAQFNLGKAYSDLGRFAEAEQALRSALQADSEHEDARYTLGIVYQKTGRETEAVDVLNPLVQQAPSHIGAHYHLALALIALDRTDEAMRHYEDVIALRPADAALAYDIGQAFYSKHDYREAGTAFKYATMVKPDLLRAYLKAGNGYQKIAMLTEAEDQFRAGIANAGPESDHRVLTALHFNLGNVLMVQERVPEGIGQYARALELDPTHVNAQYGLGLAYEHESEFESAIEAYEATLRLDPNHEGAKTQLSLLQTGELPADAD